MMVLAFTGLLVAVGMLVVGVLVHRDLVAVGDRLGELGLQPDLQCQLDQFWHEVVALHSEGTTASDARIQEVEAAIAQLRHRQGETTRYMTWMASWVEHWARETKATRP